MLTKLLLTGPFTAHLGLLLARVGLGLMMAFAHGWEKLIGGFEGWRGLGGTMALFGMPEATFIFWGFMAAVAEFFGGLLLALGLLHRLAAFLLINTMVVATYLHYSQGDSFAHQTSRPIELGLVFLALFVAGPGRYSLDQMLFGRGGTTAATNR